MKKYFTTRQIAIAGIVGAAYTCLCLLLEPISFGVYQLRVAEALCVLPAFFPGAVFGLFIGCIVSNLLGGFGLLDILLGSLATLAAAALARRLRKYPWLVPSGAVLFNAIAIGFVLHIAAGAPLLLSMGMIFVEQLCVCYGLGMPLFYALRRLSPEQLARMGG
jgi:uncharacterized membrane protein